MWGKKCEERKKCRKKMCEKIWRKKFSVKGILRKKVVRSFFTYLATVLGCITIIFDIILTGMLPFKYLAEALSIFCIFDEKLGTTCLWEQFFLWEPKDETNLNFLKFIFNFILNLKNVFTVVPLFWEKNEEKKCVKKKYWQEFCHSNI